MKLDDKFAQLAVFLGKNLALKYERKKFGHVFPLASILFIRVILTFEVPAAVALLGKNYCPKLILTNIN